MAPRKSDARLPHGAAGIAPDDPEIHLDTVALDFPELKLVGAHTGCPWTEEMIAVAYKHPNRLEHPYGLCDAAGRDGGPQRLGTRVDRTLPAGGVGLPFIRLPADGPGCGFCFALPAPD